MPVNLLKRFTHTGFYNVMVDLPVWYLAVMSVHICFLPDRQKYVICRPSQTVRNLCV